LKTEEKLKKIINEKVLVLDGAMGTYLSRFNLKDEDFGGYEGLNEYLSISKPEVIKQVYIDYLKAGADIIETNTFGANRIILKEYGLESKVKELNLAAVKLAKEAVKECSSEEQPRFIAGSIGPTTKSLFVTGGISFEEFSDVYFEQISVLIEGGVDIIMIETAHDILNIKAAYAATAKAFKKYSVNLLVIISVTMDNKNTMLSGQAVEAVYVSLEHLPLFALGFNCSTGPKDMALRLESLSKISKFPVFAMPNAGLPDENGAYTESPEEFSKTLSDYAEKKYLNIVGGCCGTEPKHIQALSEALKNKKPRMPLSETSWAISGIEPLFYDEIEPPILAGERNNSIGSKKFRDIVAAGNWDEAVALAKAQVKAGAHMLDICLSNPERNEIEDAKIFLPKIFHSLRVPVMIDTTDIKVMEEVLKMAPGKCVLNSVNFEFGDEGPAKVAQLMKLYGAKAVFGVIDEDKEKGLPLTCARKMEIARRGYKFFTEKCGISGEDIIFDALVFPVAVGEDYKHSAQETLKGIAQMKKEFPLSKSVLGISNVSFGLPLKGREILNSVFLHHAVKAGLDMAIVNTQKLKRYALISKEEKKLAEDLIFASSPDAIKVFADYFRGKKAETSIEDIENIEPEEKLYRHILEGIKSGIEETIGELLKKNQPMDIINGPILKSMGKVGKLFAKGDLIVTEVLQSAETVKKSVEALAPALKSMNIPKRGKVLLATVKGDVHDIGKNLVHIIFESNGFEVIDLGVKIPPEVIVENALRENPDFIGLSGLLVRSTEQMTITARELAKVNISKPLLLGGAALTEKFVDSNIVPIYKGKVFYASDAMAGLNTALEYILKSREGKDEGAGQTVESGLQENAKISTEVAMPTNQNKEYFPDKIPVPKNLDRHFFDDYDLAELFNNLNEDVFNLRFLKLKKTDTKKLEETKKVIEEVKKYIILHKIIKPRGVYKFFKVNSENNKIMFFDGADDIAETIYFPRQMSGENLSITDFIAPMSGKERDFMALFIVTCGQGIREFSKAERDKGNYLRSYIIEALSLSLAESFAEVIHHKIRENWGIGEENMEKPLHLSKYKGKRYSFGYPVCPDLSNQAKIFNLLKPQQDVKVELTDNFMMEPEASVSAFVLHNEKSKYFTV
jgi:5-methyltetrahydrofolate--homocysteine methyltransferase